MTRVCCGATPAQCSKPTLVPGPRYGHRGRPKVQPELKGLRSVTATEFKRTEEDMLDYLDNAAIGLHWVDGNGIILWANPADYEPLGYTAEEWLGHNITEFHAEQTVINDILARLLGGETLYNYKAKLLRKDGSTQSVLIASSGQFDENNNFVHTRCFTINDPTI
jgi:PAS domain S-box-containing protein